MLTRKCVWEGLPNHEIEMKVRAGERVRFIFIYLLSLKFQCE